MILIDTSAWVEFLRGTASPACNAVDAALGADIACCGPVRMEVLAGARNARHHSQLAALLARAHELPTHEHTFEHAAAVFRACRAGGDTVRRLIDCLIAAVAIEADLALLQADRDFEAIARHTSLRLAPI